MKKEALFALFCVIALSVASTVWAQPTLPKESIPAQVSAEVKEQIQRLYSSDAVDRGSAAFHLAKMGERAVPAIPFLVANLHDSAPIISCGVSGCQDPHHDISPADEAEKTLLKFGKASVDPLLASLQDKDPQVRRRITGMLGKIKDPRSVPGLLSAMKDENRNVSMAAATSLTEIGEPSMTGLTDVLKNPQIPIETRADAAWALGIIKKPGAVEPLIAALNEKDPDLLKQASRSLSRITGNDLGQDPKKWQEWWEKNRPK
jgi:HEAT repeat protein